MPAYELFTATTTNLFIEHVKTKAEAYGWTIDFFSLYNGNNRLHLHNSLGSHFEIWYASSLLCNIRACTGYSSTDTPLAQPGTSGTVSFPFVSYAHFVVICQSSIYIKAWNGNSTYNVQFGTIVDKVGGWTGGSFISSSASNTAMTLWGSWSTAYSQVYINGVWTTLGTVTGGSVAGYCESELYSKMPFVYSGGILPVPMLLVQLNQTTPANLHPIGYAPDVRFFRGGDVYPPLVPVVIDGDSWMPFSTLEGDGGWTTANILVRLAA